MATKNRTVRKEIESVIDDIRSFDRSMIKTPSIEINKKSNSDGGSLTLKIDYSNSYSSSSYDSDDQY